LLWGLEAVGLEKRKFGLHSLRSGGATAAAAAGIDDRLFKKHGVGKVIKLRTVMSKKTLMYACRFLKI
jgi:hypothetical protein